MRFRLVYSLLILSLFACGGEETISIQLFPAVLAADPKADPPPGWIRVEFAGSRRAPAGVYYVEPDTLLTEFGIIAFRLPPPSAPAQAITARLSAYTARRLQRFSADPEHLKKPLALRIDGRWADFAPLLKQTGERLTLYGFTRREVERLDRYLKTR